jgi:hypothetical protein
MTDPALDLPGLRRQFADSVETLGGLEERLRSVTLADETINASSKSIDAGAAALSDSAALLGEVAQALRASASAIADGLARVDQFLAQTDMAALDKRLDSMSSLLSERLAAIERQVGLDASAAQDKIAQLEADLSAARQLLSGRQLKKLDGENG